MQRWERERERGEGSNNIYTYCVMLFDRSSWSPKHSSTSSAYIYLARKYWFSGLVKDETFITMNPHNWKYYHSHTVLKQIQQVCILNVHRTSHICNETGSYLCHFSHLSISVTQFGLSSFPQWCTRRQTQQHSILFRWKSTWSWSPFRPFHRWGRKPRTK